MTNSQVLIVDDNEQNRYLLQAILQGYGYEVVTANDGAEALGKARIEPPDLVIADILMPVMDGFALCREWKTDVRLKLIPFVFYTATYTDERDREFALSLGAERFVIKPEEPGTLVAIIRETLQQIQNTLPGQAKPTTGAAQPPITESAEKEAVRLGQYNESLIRKLENKMEQLELTNRELEQRIFAHLQTEKALRSLHLRQEAILGSVPDIIMEVDNNKTYIWANQAGIEFFGEDVLGKEAASYFVGEQQTYNSVQPLFDGGEGTFYVESWQRRKDGEKRLLAWWCQVLKDGSGKVTGAISTGRDITDSKEAEEERLRVIELSADLICVAGMDGYFKSVNPAWERILGYSRPELLIRPFLDFIHPEDHHKNDEEVARLAAGKTTIDFENRYLHKNGSVRHISWTATPDPEKGVMYCIGRDITERKQADETLKRSERKLREAQEMAHLGYWQWDVKTGEVEWSEEVFKIFGLDPAKFTPQIDSILALSPWPEDHQRDMELINRAIKSHEPGFYEQKFLRPDQSIGHYYSTFQGNYDEAGDLISIVGTVLDIAERKRVEAELVASQQQYRELFENVNLGILRTTPGPEGAFIEANPAALRIFEAESREEFFAVRPIDIYYNPEQRQMVCDEILTKGFINGMEVRYKTLKGRLIWGRITSIKKVSEDGQIYFDNTLEDVTERKRAEEALRESEKQVRRKLDAILSPEADIGALELSDIIDGEMLQKLMNEFYQLTNIGIGIIDLNGRVLVGTGWQDICTKFHRTNPVSRQLCIESDLELSRDVPAGSFKLYRCRNNMWDMATPIMLGDKHVGNIFLGQFLFDDETPDYETFRQQARQYGFDEQEYMAALDRVPRWSRRMVDATMSFYAVFAGMIGNLSYANIKLASALDKRKRAEEALQNAAVKYRIVADNTYDWEFWLSPAGEYIYVSPSCKRITGYEADEFRADPKLMERIAYPDDRPRLADHRHELVQHIYPGELEYRIVHSDGTIHWIGHMCQHVFDEKGHFMGTRGSNRDITERKRAEEALGRLLARQDRLATLLHEDVFVTGTFTEKLKRITDAVVEVFDADFCRIWVIQSGDLCNDGCMHAEVTEGPHVCRQRDRCLHLMASSGRYTHIDGQGHRRVPFGCYKIGKVASAQNRKFLTNDAVNDSQVHNHEWARELGLVAFAGYRLVSSIGKPIGVMALFAKHPISPDEDALLEGLSTSCSHMIQRAQAQEDLIRHNEELQMEITERKRAEENLRSANDFLRAIIEAAPTAVIGLDLEGRVQNVWNPAAEKMLGWSAEEAMGNFLPSVPLDKEEEFSRFRDSIRSGRTLNGIEVRRHRRDGTLIDYSIYASPLHGPDGQITGNVAVLLDITERKQAEEEMREAHRRLDSTLRFTESVIAAVPIPLFYKDREGRYLGVNDAFAELMGFTPDYYRGKTVMELWPDHFAQVYHEKDLELMSNPERQVYEFKVLDKNGVTRIAIWSKDVFRDENGQVAGIVGAFQDVTERKRAEDELRRLNTELDQRVMERTAQLEAANKDLEAFSYSVSHDLRAPLRSMDGFSQALLEDHAGQLDEKGKDYLGRVRAASQRMERLVDDMLILSRVSRTEMHLITVDLSALAHAIMAELQSSQPERRVEFIITPGLVAQADPNLMRIALENLLDNAWKFTSKHPTAKIEFGVMPSAPDTSSTPATAGNAEGATLFVRDDGAGFDMAHAAKLFGAFQRLHSSAEFAGTGIGLATVQRVIRRQDGRVWAEAGVEQGATFYFTLPN